MSNPEPAPRPAPPDVRPDFEFSPAARNLLSAVCRRDGRHAVLLCWPAGVTYLPHDYFAPGPFDMVIDRVEGCPVYVDIRRLGLFANRRVVIDVERSSVRRRRPPLRVRPVPSRPRVSAGDEAAARLGHRRPRVTDAVVRRATPASV